MKTTKKDQLVKEYKNFVQSNEDKFEVSALNEFEKIIDMEDPRAELANFFDEHSEKLGDDEENILMDINERHSLMNKGQEISLNGICLNTISGKPFEFSGEKAMVEAETNWDSVYFNYEGDIWFAPLNHVTKVEDH